MSLSKGRIDVAESISMWIMQNGGIAWSRYLRQSIAAFERTYPEYTVSVTLIPWLHAWQRLLEAHKRHRLPDVVQIGTTWLHSLVHFGIIQPIPTMLPVSDEPDPLGVRRLLAESASVNGESYGISLLGDTRLLYINTDLVEDFGPIDFLDYESFVRHAAELRRHGKEILVMASEGTDLFLQNLGPWIWSAGGDYLSSDDSSFQLLPGKPGFDGLMEFLRFVEIGGLSSLPQQGASGLVFSRFFRERASCFAIYSFSTQDALENQTAVPFPRINGFHHQFLGGSYLALSASAQQPQAATSLALWLTQASKHSLRAVDETPGDYHAPLRGLMQNVSPVMTQNDLSQQLRFHTMPSHPLWPVIEPVIANTIGQLAHRFSVGTGKPSDVGPILMQLRDRIQPLVSKRR